MPLATGNGGVNLLGPREEHPVQNTGQSAEMGRVEKWRNGSELLYWDGTNALPYTHNLIEISRSVREQSSILLVNAITEQLWAIDQTRL